MQLDYSSTKLRRMLRLFALLAITFLAGSIMAFFVASEPKRLLATGAAAVCGFICLWVTGRLAWMLASNVPAVCAKTDGIEVNSFINRKFARWADLASVSETIVQTRTKTVPVLQLARTSGLPIRVPVDVLANSRVEIEQWTRAAVARMLSAERAS